MVTWLFGLCAFLIILVFAYRNTFQANVNRIAISINRSVQTNGLEQEPLRILHLSDLHMENISITAEQIVADWKDEPLDLIAITGDFLDRARNIPKALAFVKTLLALKPKYGAYAVFGNHDYVLPPDQLAILKEGLNRLGCRVLQNEAVTLDCNGNKLHLIGIDDFATRRSNLSKAFAGADDKGIRLVLTHDPNIVLHMGPYHYDYLLAGHFHGGQIHWPKPYHLWKMGKLPRMNMVKGLHFYHGRPFYISEGLGQTGINIRLRSRPEITLHTLRVQAHSNTNPAAAQAAKANLETAPALAID
ncbi:MAG: metallophosphoesterase [Brevibacillus sp.]|nr:metallophosphoesterase [Brevibacillus sp.]